MTAAQNDTAIYNQVTRMGQSDKLARIMAAQARYESADYTSRLSSYNNMFGYKYVPGSKWQSGKAFISPEGDYYAAYSSTANSAGEIVDWLKRRQAEGYFTIASLTTPAAYANAIKSAGYYGQAAYLYANGLVEKYGLVTITAASIGGLLLVIGIVLLISKNKAA